MQLLVVHASKKGLFSKDAIRENPPLKIRSRRTQHTTGSTDNNMPGQEAYVDS